MSPYESQVPNFLLDAGHGGVDPTGVLAAALRMVLSFESLDKVELVFQTANSAMCDSEVSSGADIVIQAWAGGTAGSCSKQWRLYF